MTVKANGKTYEFKLSSRESVTTDDKGVETSAEERQNSFTQMMKIALDVAVAMENK